jgi:hypothetical protein
MSTEVAAGQEASAEMEEKRGLLGGLADTAKAVISLPFEPVVGGLPANVSFRLLALSIIGLAISSLVNATQTWGVPVSEITVRFVALASLVPLPVPLCSATLLNPACTNPFVLGSYETELVYPDFYICLPEVFAQEFKESKALYIGSGFSESADIMAGIRTACNQVGLNGVGASAPIKVDPLVSNGYFGSKTSTPPHADACTYGRASGSGIGVANFVSGLAKDDVGDDGKWDPADPKVGKLGLSPTPCPLAPIESRSPPARPTPTTTTAAADNQTSLCVNLCAGCWTLHQHQY